jgi:hypothetical protein
VCPPASEGRDSFLNDGAVAAETTSDVNDVLSSNQIL